jgi:argininosuccinate lyase
MLPQMESLNRSLGTDIRLWPQDIRGSQAWASALAGAGVLSQQEGEALVEGLEAVAHRLSAGGFDDAPDEDVHTLVERLLGEEVGELAGKLHTGRSRNDQVATDFRLWGMEVTSAIDEALRELGSALVALAERGIDLIVPGHTHLQQAQPLRAAQWALSHLWPILRDRNRFQGASERAGEGLPLGSGALAGCPFPIDREWLRETLGFRSVSENSLDSVADRDWALEMAFAGALLGIHLSRLGEDLVLLSSQEFGVLRLPEGFCTGSSLMPQKRNPDVAELVRGKTGRLVGNLTGLLTLLKGLPSGYNRDLQEDKELLFDTADTLKLVLPPLTGALADAEFTLEGEGQDMDAGLLATDLADYLVRKGVPFRESHGLVGRVVRRAEDLGLSLSSLPLDAFREIHPSFEADVKEVFSFEASVEARAAPGGTARGAVEAQLASARELLTS